MPSKIAVYYSDKFLLHDTGFGHPERPDRLHSIIKAIDESNIKAQLNFPNFAPATIAQLQFAHTSEYINIAKEAIDEGYHQLPTGDTVISKGSWEAALLAAGAVISACDSVIANQFKSAFCLVRPPGHHATAERGMGFCIFNNIAIAARHLQKSHGIKKVLIVDFDVHHGNGTQDIFYADNTVFYFSIHEKDIYPGSGHEAETGINKGQGYTQNVELKSGDGDYKAISAIREKLIPAMQIFQPEFILVSAGFDAHQDDPLGHLKYTASGYGALAKELSNLASQYANGHIVFTLEGGYHLNGLSESVVKILEILTEKI